MIIHSSVHCIPYQLKSRLIQKESSQEWPSLMFPLMEIQILLSSFLLVEWKELKKEEEIQWAVSITVEEHLEIE